MPLLKLSNSIYYYGAQMGLMHLALAQAPVVLGDIEKNIEIMETLIIDAQSKCKDKLDLIAFPDWWLKSPDLVIKKSVISPTFLLTPFINTGKPLKAAKSLNAPL